MASGLTCRLALVCAPPTASILCRSRPPCSTGISWPRSRIRACPGAGRGLVGGYHRYPDRRGLALPGRDPRPVHPQDSWLGDARAYARRTYQGGVDHGDPATPPSSEPDPSFGPRQPVCRRRLSQDPAGRRHHPIDEPQAKLPGQCADESDFGTLKPNSSISANTPTAMPRDLVASIEAYYNRRPIHSAIAYITPEQADRKTA